MNPSQCPSSGQQARVNHYAGNADSYAFFNLLTGPQLLDRLEAQLPEHRERKFPPTETLSMFLAQALSADGGCQQALNDHLVKRVMAGLDPGSTATGAYCKARARLPLSMVSSLALGVGALVAGEVPGWWLWRGRRVRLVDGTTVTLADTEENHLITLRKPERPEWMSQWEYDQVPATLKVRELKAGGKILVTTFLNPKKVSKREVAALLSARWHVELDIRNIKTTLGMEQLRCKTPQMALKELWVYLLAYNLIRLLMAQSALLADQIPRQLSFKHSVQIWLTWQQRATATDDAVAINALLVLIAGPRVGRRPGRIEPRALKRRPKPFPRLTQQRAAAREQIREHGHPKKQR